MKHFASGEEAIALCARRTAAEWKAGETLRKKLVSHGADAETVQRYAEKLAEAMRRGE